MQIDSYNYKLKHVEPTGFNKGEIYIIPQKPCLMKNGGKDEGHDLTRLAVCVQGLINRGFKNHGCAIALDMDVTDDFWLDYITEDNATYGKMERVKAESTQDMLDKFMPFLKENGLVVWDPFVPSTANVASTMCGLFSCVPVKFNEDKGSLYDVLVNERKIPVKHSLVGMFEGAVKGEKIKNTELVSTGSPKCDAYIWAMDKFMPECNPEFLAYTLDGAPSCPQNPTSKTRDAYSARITGIPNHDYFVYKQCFFFDLTPYRDEAPIDEPDQPIGADGETLRKILKRRYDLANGRFGEVLGFPPWHVKYTAHVGNYDLIPPRLEWHFVECCTSYNCGIEADAANPAWMSNGSLYTNYTRRYEPKGNKVHGEIKYEPGTKYYTICYTGDFDCSPWMKWRVPMQWTDKNVGKVTVAYNYGINLIERIPMAFDYVYQHQTENDYLTAGEGMGYVVADAMFKGFIGKEANPEYSHWTRYPREKGSPVERTLPDCDKEYIEYAEPYYRASKLDISGKLINCFTQLSKKALAVYNKLSPKGGFLCNITAGKYDFQTYNGVPYFRVIGFGGDTLEKRCEHAYEKMMSRDSDFIAYGFCDNGLNCCTPSGVKEFIDAFEEHIKKVDPEGKYRYVDIDTFLRLAAESGQGVKREEQPGD